MPAGRYGPQTNLVISEESAKQLEFLVMISRAYKGDQNIEGNDVVEDLVAQQYNKVRAVFNKAMETLESVVQDGD